MLNLTGKVTLHVFALLVILVIFLTGKSLYISELESKLKQQDSSYKRIIMRLCDKRIDFGKCLDILWHLRLQKKPTMIHLDFSCNVREFYRVLFFNNHFTHLTLTNANIFYNNHTMICKHEKRRRRSSSALKKSLPKKIEILHSLSLWFPDQRKRGGTSLQSLHSRRNPRQPWEIVCESEQLFYLY